MPDHASVLMARIGEVLLAEAPLPGGWNVMRLKTPLWPVGYIDLTNSTPNRGQNYYSETHAGVISVWVKGELERLPDPREALLKSEQAHRALGAAVMSVPGLDVYQFQCGALTPSQPDGLTYGRTFTFSAVTKEVISNG